MNMKITQAHQSKPAYIYVRQSTLAQVRHNQESTERQYALKDKALTLGWPQRSIKVLDRDLGQSGAQMSGREDFKTLVADVSMGQVGAVFALEVSRLARSNLDWHRLLELCALTHTLVIDADGCYDPGDFNDGLLLGLKGTMAQAELHFLRGRLLGGKLNKAQKGELRFPLPVGFCCDDQDRIVVDPDEEVRGAVALVFRLFQETGSAYAVVQRFAREGLRFPKRSYGGSWAGKLIWGRLAHGRVLSLIKNPSYAGAYVFGRHQYAKTITAEAEVHKNVRLMPTSQWRVKRGRSALGLTPVHCCLILTPHSIGCGVFLVRPAWAHSWRCKSSRELVTVSEVKRNCMRATECGKEARSINREPMNKNCIEGAVKQGKRAKNREALVTKAKRRRCGGCAMKECVLTWGDLALYLKGRRCTPEREVSRGRSSAGSGPMRQEPKHEGPNERE